MTHDQSDNRRSTAEILANDTIADVAVEYLGRQEGIIGAYLFGSRAKGSAGKRSDIDIAVLASRSGRNLIDRLELMTALSDLLGADVDLVMLNTASPLLYHEVRSHGHLILDRDPRERKKIEILQRKLYQDYLHLHGIYMDGTKRRYGRS